MKTLKLDNSFRPIDVIDSLNAYSLVRREKADLVECYDKKIKCGENLVPVPAVIVLRRYVNYKFFRIVPSRRNVYERDKYRCQYCLADQPYSKLTLDHVIPKSKGGDYSWSNIVCCCKKCNQKKGNKMPGNIGMIPSSFPVKPKYDLIDYLGPNLPKLWLPYLNGYKTN